MAVITVPAGGALVSNVTLNDTLQAAPGVDLKGNPVLYEIDGVSTLHSLIIGYDIQLSIGFLNGGSLTGTGNITGPSDASVGNLPLLYNYGAVDINGMIGVNFTNEGRLTVSAGELLAVGADLLSFGSSTVTVASGGELDINSRDPAVVSTIDVEGTLKTAAPLSTFTALTNNGSIDVSSGKLTVDSSLQGHGTITVESGATLFLETAPNQTASGTTVLKSGSTLQLGSQSSFTGTLQAQDGARIDLLGVSATGATVANGAIAVATSAGTVSLAETGLTNGTSLTLASDGAGGSLITVSGASTPVNDLAVYRFFDKTYGTHFFTGSSAEAANVEATRSDLVYEGVGLYSVNAATDPNAAPVYRFFDTKFGTHFYTSSASEEANVKATRPDLTYEGIDFYEHATQQTADVPVYRFFDTHYGTHFYTASATEEASIASTRPDLVNEGIGFYAPST